MWKLFGGKHRTELYSTDPLLLDMLNVQNVAIFTNERPKVPLLRVGTTTSCDSAGQKWYNHCSTLEGGIFPSLATVKLRMSPGKRK